MGGKSYSLVVGCLGSGRPDGEGDRLSTRIGDLKSHVPVYRPEIQLMARTAAKKGTYELSEGGEQLCGILWVAVSDA